MEIFPEHFNKNEYINAIPNREEILNLEKEKLLRSHVFNCCEKMKGLEILVFSIPEYFTCLDKQGIFKILNEIKERFPDCKLSVECFQQSKREKWVRIMEYNEWYQTTYKPQKFILEIKPL